MRKAGTTDADAVTRVLDDSHFDDMFARHATWRAADHMVMHDLYIAEVVASAKLAEPHAWYGIVATVPAEIAFPVGTECRMAR